MTEKHYRTRPGFISDAEDMLHDIEEIDRLNEGKMTRSKADSIRRFVRYGGRMASPEWLAENFKVPVEAVYEVIAAMEKHTEQQ
jgi:hypothetical protein